MLSFNKYRSSDFSLKECMKKKIKITVKKEKGRIPVPQKPPKVEEKPKAYKRTKAKREAKEKIDEDLKKND